MADYTWKSILTKLVLKGEHLTQEESAWYVDELMDGNADEVPVAAVLATQQQLGLTADEVAGAAGAMVDHAIPLKLSKPSTDIVGTGGDGFATVNISSTASIIAAAAGVTIAKHGNRAASSKSGAADCLEALGLPLDLTPDQVAQVGEKVGITFAFARTFHPAMRFVGPIRAKLGIPCVFNVLGPITNPAHPAHCAIGCADRKMGPVMAEVLRKQGATGMVFTSAEGMDELAATGPAAVWLISADGIEETSLDPAKELGLPPVTVEDLKGGTPEYNAEVSRKVIAGEKLPSTDTIMLNAAAAIVADGSLLPDPAAPLADRFTEALGIARDAVASGKAAAKLDEWISTAKAVKAAEA